MPLLLPVKESESHSPVQLCGSMDCSQPGPLSTGFSMQEYWSGQPFLSPGALPDPEIKAGSPACQADSSPSELQVSPLPVKMIAADLPLEKPVCRSGSNSQNRTWNNRLVPNREKSTSRLDIVTLLI